MYNEIIKTTLLMASKSFIKKLKTDYQKRESERRQIISASNEILHDAKQAIFALHRNEIKTVAKKLQGLEQWLKNLEKTFKFQRLTEEDSFNAALEEYAEAKLFFQVMNGEHIQAFKQVSMTTKAYIGGLSDLTGELVRVATNRAAQGRFDDVALMQAITTDLMAELVTFDFRGYLRTKYDQAKNNLRKMEQISYDVAIRRHN